MPSRRGTIAWLVRVPTRLTTILLAIATVACGGPAPTSRDEPVVDLIALLPYSDDGPRTLEVRPGDPADRTHLVRGWSAPVLVEGTAGARIVNGRIGTLLFHAGRKPRAMTVHIDRVRERPEPPPPPGRSGRRRVRSRSRMLIDVNGHVVRRARTSLETASGTYEVPVELLQAGRNLLSIREGSASPSRERSGPGDWVYTRISFEPAGGDETSPRAEGDRLILPAGTQASFFFRAPHDATLRLALGGAGSPDSAPQFTAAVTIDGQPRRLVVERTPDAPGEQRHALGVAPGEIVRLTLALGDRGNVSGAAVALVHPVIEGRPSGTGAPAAPAPAAVASRPNVILYVADTLRADRLGCYGRRPSITPAIDRLAAEGIVFENAVAQSPWTRPSTATILTGRDPAAHGAVTLRTRVRRDLPTLGDFLGARGWRTAAFVTNLNVAPAFGFGRGFTPYEYLPEDVRRPGVYEPASVLHEKALAWIDAHRDEPFLLYLHASDPHAPYRPTDPARPQPMSEEEGAALHQALMRTPRRLDDGAVASLRRLYDEETAEFDTEIGRFWDALGSRGLANDTLVMFVADHGEEFREHGMLQHGNTLYQEVMHVPLIVRLPGGRGGGRRVASLARHVDLVPTLLAALGVETNAPLSGRALALGDASVPEDGEATVDTWFGERALQALVVPPWKIVLPRLVLAARPEVYDLRQDPAERTNLARRHPMLIGYAKQRLAELEAAHAGELATADEHAEPVNPDALERLRALGYVVD